MRTNALLIGVAVVLLVGRAVDQSFADAGALREGAPMDGGASPTTPFSRAVVAELAAPSLSASKTASILAIRSVFRSRSSAAIEVSRCETGGSFDPHAVNWRDHHSDGSHGSFGLFQIGALHRSPGESVRAFARRMFDPVANAWMAYRLSRGGTRWGPWGRCG